MTLFLMQGHSGSPKAKHQRYNNLSATKQAISVKLATTVGLVLLYDLDLDFANIYIACPTCFIVRTMHHEGMVS